MPGIAFYNANHSFYRVRLFAHKILLTLPIPSRAQHSSENPWVALNTTFYTGGQSSANTVCTKTIVNPTPELEVLALPVELDIMLKIAYNKVLVLFKPMVPISNTVSLGWTTSGFAKPKASEEL